MIRALLIVVVLGVLFLGCRPPAISQDGPVEARIDRFIQAMTLEEKLAQLHQLDGNADGSYRADLPGHIRSGLGSTLNVRGAQRTNELQRIALEQTRLKIPLLFAFDVIHGYRTIFPVSLGEAASWDPNMAELSASIASDEATAAGLRWTFAPMVDIARDPRWGRVVEGAGEDPLLGAAFAAARVRGFQRSGRLVACAKHWVAHGAAQAGRDYFTVDVSERALREIYFPPFEAAVKAGVGTFMSAFNDLNGVPATGNEWILQDVLRQEWGFKGMVVSDWAAVRELVSHGIAKDGAEAALLALTAGIDMEMVSTSYKDSVARLIKSGKLSESVVDDAVRRVLRTKFRVGLFDKPYCDVSLEASTLLTDAHRQAARRIAARSCVLLKNDNDLLPLQKSVRSIAVVGPLANSQVDMIGSWWGDGRRDDAASVLFGIQTKLPQARVLHAADLNGAVSAAQQADVVVVVVGEPADMSGEAASRTSLDLPGDQVPLVQAVHNTGKPYVVVLLNGRPLTFPWISDHSPAILEAWLPGTEGGHAVADVLFGDVNPGGKLPITFPRSLGQVPIFYNHRNTGRPAKPLEKYTSKYIDESNFPRYPFGYGLSYTTFAFSNLKVSLQFQVQVDVQNTGRRAGDEVVQLYLHDAAASVTRPVRELKAFRRITLQPDEKQTVTFNLTRDDFAFYNRSMKKVVEPGPVSLYVGNSSNAILMVTVDVP